MYLCIYINYRQKTILNTLLERVCAVRYIGQVLLQD